MKLYVASSWRNQLQPIVVSLLREVGHDVYDFRNPPGATGFAWREIDEEWERWTPEQYIKALEHTRAEAGFTSDFNAMRDAEGCVLVLPCGRSAHLEAGWFVGQGRPVFVLLDQSSEPELMYKLAARLCTDEVELLIALREQEAQRAVAAPESGA